MSTALAIHLVFAVISLFTVFMTVINPSVKKVKVMNTFALFAVLSGLFATLNTSSLGATCAKLGLYLVVIIGANYYSKSKEGIAA